MPFFDLDLETRLHFDEQGQGRPIVFLPGWCVSARLFQDQLSRFSSRYHASAIDYRAHGQSTQTLVGHSLAGYARDVHQFLVGQDLQQAVLVGHSMGGFVAWDYFRQFGADRLAGLVIIDQPPCETRRPDWPHGEDLLEACRFVISVQERQEEIIRQLLNSASKKSLPAEEIAWRLAEMMRVPAVVAGIILLDDLSYDARPVLPQVSVPTLLCWGRHSKLTPLAAGEYIAQTQPDARLVIFEESGHRPYAEEPALFHDTVNEFVASL